MMNEQEVLQVLGQVGAVITNSHIVYTSGKHGTAYINKDAVYPHTVETSKLCRAIAEHFADDGVEVVIAPEKGGIILSQWVAYHLTELTKRDVLAVYAEREEKSLVKVLESTTLHWEAHYFELHYVGDLNLERKENAGISGGELLLRRENFIFKRGYDALVKGKRVLVVEDVLTTGGSARKTIEATRASDGTVVGLGVLCNRGGITSSDVADPPKLFALVNVQFDAWDEAGCPLCKNGVPINIWVGKGRDFLARKKAS